VLLDGADGDGISRGNCGMNDRGTPELSRILPPMYTKLFA